jgi:hypothetical protein
LLISCVLELRKKRSSGVKVSGRCIVLFYYNTIVASYK